MRSHYPLSLPPSPFSYILTQEGASQMNKQTPRAEALFAELEEPIFHEYFEPDLTPEFMTVESSSELLEHEMIQTFLQVMREGRRDSDRLKAASDVGEIIGKKGKQNQLQLIRADNVQINQIEQNPALKAHLIESARGLAALTGASNANVQTRQGGKGV